jgi:hypothetical protein
MKSGCDQASGMRTTKEAVDFVVGGCGTGLGYLNAVMQYPGVVCGHLLSPALTFPAFRPMLEQCAAGGAGLRSALAKFL